MKRTLLILFSIGYVSLSFSKPVLTKSKYLISTLYDNATGTVCPGNETYPLAYNPDNDADNAVETDYWLITELGNNEYCFQNAATLQYIKHDITVADRSALTLVSSLQADKSTSFSLELNIVNNLCYYEIRSFVNTTKVWNRRTTAYNSIYPVGVYSDNSANIEQFIFYNTDGEPVIDDTKTAASLPNKKQTLGAFATFADTLTFNKKTPAVDTSNKEFYVSVPTSSMNTDMSFNIRFVPKNTSNKLYINNIEITNGSNFRFNSLSASDKHTIELRNGATVIASGTLIFTGLPIVQVYTDATIGSAYMLSKIAVTEPGKIDSTEVLFSSIKVRGATSSTKPKKSYALKLKNTDGATPIDRTYFNLREDNNWILDAMYIDPSRMRNRVSTDLWNDFSTKPYYAAAEPKMINGTRGQFVEVFLNDAYNGLYCMTEKVDRKQLKLKKLLYPNLADSSIVVQRGGLFKAVSWSVAALLGNTYYNNTNYSMPSMYDNTKEAWNGMEVKYPDFGDGEPIEWKSLYDAVIASSNLTNDDIFKANIANIYDLPVFLDYYLFIELMLATDNQGKNTFLSVYDQTVSSKLSITPWDCDGTWGRKWDGSSNSTTANQNYETFSAGHQSNLFLRLRKLNLNDYSTQLKKRYTELRGNYFDYNNLITRFQNYFNLFEKSGAQSREGIRWPMSNSIANEKPFLSNWISQRLAYLDNQYLGAPYTSTNIHQKSKPNIQCTPNPVRDRLYISNLNTGDIVTIFTAYGNAIIQTAATEEMMTVDMSKFKQGIYFVKANNSTIKIIKD